MDTGKSLDPERVRVWFDTFLRDRCVCQYCGFDGKRTPADWVQLQGDHLIPRGIAGEHAEDPLNRVTACFYCNTLKKQFDPAQGQFTKIPSIDVQRQLIERARAQIEKQKESIWRYGGGLQSSFQFMLDRLV